MKSPGLRLYSSRKKVYAPLSVRADSRVRLLQVDFLLGAAVDGEVQVHRDNAVIVFGARLREHFFEVRRFLIASGFVE